MIHEFKRTSASAPVSRYSFDKIKDAKVPQACLLLKNNNTASFGGMIKSNISAPAAKFPFYCLF